MSLNQYYTHSHSQDPPDIEGYQEARVLSVQSLAENTRTEGGGAIQSLPVQRPRQHQEGRPVDGLHLEGGTGVGTAQSYRDIFLHCP